MRLLLSSTALTLICLSPLVFCACPHRVPLPAPSESRTVTRTDTPAVPDYVAHPVEPIMEVVHDAPPPVPAPPACDLRPVYFAFDSDALSDVARHALNDDARCPQPLTVSGYCDPRGSAEYNLVLSQQRANVTAEYLRGLGARIDRAIGSGESQATGTDAAGWARDRRAEVAHAAP